MEKYAYVFIIGIIGKLYDDLTELYLVKNPRILETIKTVWSLIIFYFMSKLASNAYDITWMLFVWTFLPLIDWYAFTDDPYFFSLVLSISVVGTALIFYNKYTITYLPLIFILYIICSPITELPCFELNGFFHYILKLLNILPEKESYIPFDKKTNTLEVSHDKLITRIISVLFLTCMILLMIYLKTWTTDTDLINGFTSVMYLALCNNGYFILSIINQINVLYFDKDLLAYHVSHSPLDPNPPSPRAVTPSSSAEPTISTALNDVISRETI